MPRAELFKQLTPTEMTFASKFVKSAMAGIGVSVEEDGESGLLKNTKTGSTYLAVPCPTQDGRITMFLTPEGIPYFCGTKPLWFALVDAAKSQVLLMPWDSFVTEFNKAVKEPHAGLFVQKYESHISVGVHVEWATSINLIQKMVKAKMDKLAYTQARGKTMAVAEDFGHLHVHSMYSLLDGASTIDGLAEKVALNGQKFCALTDHGIMYGTWKFYKACKDWGVKPLLGCEIYLVDDVSKRYQKTQPDGSVRDARFEYHTTVIAMNQTGWANLCKMLSKACRDDFYHVPRVDHKSLFEHNEGLIVLSGCFKGPLAWHCIDFKKFPEKFENLYDWHRFDPMYSRNVAKKYREVFGDRYYVEMMSNNFKPHMDAMPRIVEISDELGIPGVVTNDCHAETEEDGIFQQMLTKINSGGKVDELGEDKGFPYFMKSQSEIDPIGLLRPEHFTRTCEIADRCNLEFPKGFLFPKYAVQQDEHWLKYQQSKGQ